MNETIIQHLLGEMQALLKKGFEEILIAENYAEFNKQYAKDSIGILLKALGKFYEYLDLYINQSDWRKEKGYKIKSHIKKQIMTSLGNIEYTKTIYEDKKGKHLSLLDEYVGIKPKERMMDDARERIVEEVMDNSYRKTGLSAIILDSIHKQTVKNVIQETIIPEQKYNSLQCKKEVDTLYIEADEDHVPLQDKLKKYKGKSIIMDKLIYCHEGKKLEAPKSQRKVLVNPHYFAGVFDGTKKNDNLWEKVYSYIDNTYDISKIKRIYINGDGAKWIKSGLMFFPQAIFVMDKFHIMKYIKQATQILKDSKEEGEREIYTALKENNHIKLDYTFSKIYNVCKDREEKANVQKCYYYFTNNFDSIHLRLKKDDNILGCSAEGHVSHILSNRLSSRPMGWSISGCDKISKLIVYYKNGGKIKNLFNEQRKRKLTYEILNHKIYQKEEQHIEAPRTERTEIKLKTRNKDLIKYYDVCNAKLTDRGKQLLSMGLFS